MTPEKLSKTLAILEAMNSTQRWSDYHSEMYVMAIANWDDAFAADVMKCVVMQEEWRPAPARLVKIAAETASPIPDAELSYAEVIYKAQSIGLYGRPAPTRPNVFYEGPPPMSHPIVAKIVAYCGGWEMICNGEANMQEGLRKQVRAAHEHLADDWSRSVVSELQKPISMRNQELFPLWKPFEFPKGHVPGIEKMSPQLAQPSKPILTIPPPELREQFKLLRSLPPPKIDDYDPASRNMVDFPAEKRREIEAELETQRKRNVARGRKSSASSESGAS